MIKRNYFKEVCKLVESGLTISEAIDELEINSTVFYKTITKEQRLTLSQLKTSSKLYGIRGNGNGGSDIKDLHEFFTTDDFAF